MKRLLPLVWKNLRRGKKNLIFSSIGILVGTSMFTFFLGLTEGIRENVLNRLYPVNQIEVEPRSVNFMGIKERAFADLIIDDDLLSRIRRIPDVRAVYPKQRSKFQARLWGGQDLFGRELHLEAFFDGIDADLVKEELRANEGVERRKIRARYRKIRACTYDADCRAGEVCLEGTCEEQEHWRAVNDHGDRAWCGDDADCLLGQVCTEGACERGCGAEAPAGDATPASPCEADERCVDDICVQPCNQDAACSPGSRCSEGFCERLLCSLARVEDQYGSQQETRGRLRLDADRPCPLGTYCATRSVTSVEGACEEPVATLLNPFLLSIYNGTASVALNLPRISGVDLVLGLRYRILYGNSFFVRDVAKDMQVVKQCVVEGFSTKALEMGVTMPLPVVQRINARFKGRAAAAEYNSVIVETEGNEHIPAVVARLKDFGFELNENSQGARKAGNMLFILTALFAFISAIVLGISAINITHTFLMIVYQRKREIGVLRSLGATRNHIRGLFILESGLIGLAGSLLGNAFAIGLAATIDKLAVSYFDGLPFLPERFFSFTPAFILTSVGIGVLFSLLGALLPANRAAGLDPTIALRSD
jgi:ABC-type lipoprotein release transport system permease subunit